MNRKQRRAQGQTSSKEGRQGRGIPDTKTLPQGIIHAAAVKSAEALLEQERWEEAAEVYKVILKENPSNAAALYNYGRLLSDSRGTSPLPEELAEAAACFVKYLQRMPNDADALAALADIRMEQGNAAESRSLIDRALTNKPSSQTLERIGTYFRRAGDSKKALEYLDRAIAEAPRSISAYYARGTTRSFEAADPSFLRLIDIAREEKNISAKDRIHLHFALAKSFLAQGETDKAFQHFALGNKCKRDTYPRYDIAKTERHADNLISLFSEEFVDRFKGKGGHGSNRPVFVIGMPRSGSTLVDQILCSHTDVGSVGESAFFFKSIPDSKNEGTAPVTGESGRFKRAAAAMSPSMLDATSQRYLSLLKTASADTKHVVDKNLFNYLWVGMIRLTLPGAKIVHCTRHPCDIGLSIWQLLFNADMPWAYDQSEIGRYYKSYEKVMAHWNKIFPGDIYEVNYETMVGNQEEETRKLLDFCGLPWDENCLRFHETKRHVQTASHSQVRKPIYKDSLRKWKKYEQHLGPLIKAIGREE